MRHSSSTGWGWGQQLAHPPGVLIFNFDIGSAMLKIDHRDMLHEWLVPRLKWGRTSVSIIGLASRTGTNAFNLHLSERRAANTHEFLRREVPAGFPARQVVGLGELQAAAKGVRDGTEDPRFRSVLVLYGSGPTPPVPPARVQLDGINAPSDLLPRIDIGEWAQWTVDRTIDISGLMEQLPWEAIAELAGTVGFFANIVSAAIQMPILWHSVRQQNIENGKLQGFWDAMQDMSAPFNNPALLKTPLSQWPAVPVPQPRSFGLPTSVLPLNEREWLEGRRLGCQIAYRIVQRMETNPEVIKDETGNKTVFTGRQLLANLALTYGSGVADALREYINKKVGKDWPYME